MDPILPGSSTANDQLARLRQYLKTECGLNAVVNPVESIITLHIGQEALLHDTQVMIRGMIAEGDFSGNFQRVLDFMQEGARQI
jgi:hypothetical protein